MSFSEVRALYEKLGFGRDAGFGRQPAVLVVDFSCAFTDPAHALGSELSSQLGATNQVLAVARTNGVPVLFSTIAFPEDAVACELWVQKVPALAELVLGSPLVGINPRLHVAPDEPVIVKRGASTFFGTDLADRLASLNVDTLVLCGTTTSGCIRATAVDALQHQIRPVVPRECVGDRHSDPHDAALFDIEFKYGRVTSLNEVVAYLKQLVPASPRP